MLESDASSDDDAPVVKGFTVNQQFAEAYEAKKRRAELSRAKELGLLDEGTGARSDSESSESEDEGDALTPLLDLEIMKTIQMIRSRDPRVYDPNTKFYEDRESGTSSDDSDREKGGKAPKQKKLTAKDVIRQQVVEAVKAGKSNAFDEDEDDDVTDGKSLAASKREMLSRTEKVSSMLYDKEQVELRKAFKSAVTDAAGGDAASASGEDDDSDEDEDGFLKVKSKSKGDDDDDDDALDLRKALDVNKRVVGKLADSERTALKQ